MFLTYQKCAPAQARFQSFQIQTLAARQRFNVPQNLSAEAAVE